MARTKVYNVQGLGRDLYEGPVPLQADPGNNNKYNVGRMAINQVSDTFWGLAGYTGGNPVWVQLSNTGGAGSFTSLVVTGNSTFTGNILQSGGTVSMTSNGVFTLDGVAASTVSLFDSVTTGAVTFGAGLTTGTLDIGGAAQSGTLTIAGGTGVQQVDIANGASTKTINIGNGVQGNTTSINSGTLLSAVTDTLNLSNGVVNFAGSQVTANLGSGAATIGTIQVNLGTGSSAGGTTHTVNIGTGTGGGTKTVNIGNADGLTDIIELVPRESSGGATHTLNASKGRITATGLTTASTADETITITNSSVAATSGIIVGICTVTATDARPVIEKVVPGSGSFTVQYVNDGAAALDGNLIISFEVFN